MSNIQCTLESSTGSISLNSDSVYLNPDLEGLAGLPEIRTTSGVNAGYDGGWTSAQYYDARLITIRGVIADEDISKVEAKRRAIVSLVGRGHKEKLTLRVTTEAGNAYVLFCRTISCEMALQGIAKKQEFLIQLRADDPLIYDDGAEGGVEAILNVRRALGGFQIDFELPLYIGGGVNETIVENSDEAVYPVITLYGPLHSPTIINQTTSEQMQVLADLGYTITWSDATNVSGSYITTTNECDKEAPLAEFELKGNTVQDGTPTPDAPVAVQTTTGFNNVKITGKNLLKYPFEDTTVTRNHVTFTDNGDGTITANGTASAQALFWITDDIWSYSENNIVIPAGTYTISKTGSEDYRVFVTVYQKTSGLLGTYQAAMDDTTFTTTETASLTVRVAVQSGKTANNFTFKTQLEHGSSATSFEPYHAENYEVVLSPLGKNLFDKSQALTYKWLNSSTGQLTTSSDPNVVTPYMRVEVGKLYIVSGIDNLQIRVMGYENMIDNKKVTYIDNSRTGRTFTATYPFIRASIGGGDAVAVMNAIQFEEGSTATSYEAFQSIELCKLGTYQDRIYKDGDDWKIEKQTGKYTFTGGANEAWYLSGGQKTLKLNSLDTTLGYAPANAIYKYVTGGSGAIEPLFCNYGDALDAGSVVAQTSAYGKVGVSAVAGGTVAGNTDAIYVANWNNGAQVRTVDAFKALLTATPLVCYYALATPTTTTITNQALIDQLEAVGASQLFVGQNNLVAEYATGNAQGVMDIDYYTNYTEYRDTIVIDSQARTITRDGNSIYNLQAEGSEFITLAPGDNTMYLTSEQTSDEGYAEVKFKQGYLTI